MLFKIFVVGALIYLLFRISNMPNAIEPPDQQIHHIDPLADTRHEGRFEEGEYTDFEEID